MKLIPTDSNVYQQIEALADQAKVVVFVGLPGTGKSLYINQYYAIARAKNKAVDIIQWDVARKSFETAKLKTIFPIKNGQTHAGTRLSAGLWLVDYIKFWQLQNENKKDKILLIEAPLVGNRFSELAHLQSEPLLESFLSSGQVQFLLPIPSLAVRKKIEADRESQVPESAVSWSGAKLSVMHQLWLDTLDIARKKQLIETKNNAYCPALYSKIYNKILRHRNVTMLEVNEIFDMKIQNEASLHGLINILPRAAEVRQMSTIIQKLYKNRDEMNDKADAWFET